MLARCCFVVLLLQLAALPPRAAILVRQPPLVLEYHNGTLFKGNYSLNLIWYGGFSAAERAIIVDFLSSLSAEPLPVAAWWRTTASYAGGGSTVLSVGRQVMLPSKKKILSERDVRRLAAPGRHRSSIIVVLTAADVAVEGFCVSRCGAHGWASLPWGKNTRARFAYIWVGNSASQCPGQCAWPFHQPIYGPQTPPLVAPNGDAGADGMVVNLAGLLAGTVTNPFDEGFFQGPKEEPMEAASACAGIFGTGAYPGYPGNLPVDPLTGGSYNAAGANGRKFLLPAMWDPETSQCATLV